jgi:hypothetical protein
MHVGSLVLVQRRRGGSGMVCISRLTTQQFSCLACWRCQMRLVAVDRVGHSPYSDLLLLRPRKVLWSDVRTRLWLVFDRSGMFVPSTCLPVGPSIDLKLATIKLHVHVVALLQHTPFDPGTAEVPTDVVTMRSEVWIHACHLSSSRGGAFCSSNGRIQPSPFTIEPIQGGN